jgi:hypothetical protein
LRGWTGVAVGGVQTRSIHVLSHEGGSGRRQWRSELGAPGRIRTCDLRLEVALSRHARPSTCDYAVSETPSMALQRHHRHHFAPRLAPRLAPGYGLARRRAGTRVTRSTCWPTSGTSRRQMVTKSDSSAANGTFSSGSWCAPCS